MANSQFVEAFAHEHDIRIFRVMFNGEFQTIQQVDALKRPLALKIISLSINQPPQTLLLED